MSVGEYNRAVAADKHKEGRLDPVFVADMDKTLKRGVPADEDEISWTRWQLEKIWAELKRALG